MRALARIIAHGIDQLPVVNDNAVVVGIVTKGGIFKALYYIHKNIFKELSFKIQHEIKQPERKRKKETRQ